MFFFYTKATCPIAIFEFFLCTKDAIYFFSCHEAIYFYFFLYQRNLPSCNFSLFFCAKKPFISIFFVPKEPAKLQFISLFFVPKKPAKLQHIIFFCVEKEFISIIFVSKIYFTFFLYKRNVHLCQTKAVKVCEFLLTNIYVFSLVVFVWPFNQSIGPLMLVWP